MMATSVHTKSVTVWRQHFFRVQNDLLMALDSFVLMLDLSAAFDTIDPFIMLYT